MRFPLTVCGAAFAVSLIATPLAAQHRHPSLREVPHNYRDGFWIALGVGAGSESFRYRNDPAGYSRDITAPSFSLRVGGTPSQSWLLGAELFAWVNGRDYNADQEALSSALLIAQLYPASRGSFYLKGGVGVAGSYFRSYAGPGNIVATEEAGVATVLGAGLDLRVGRNVSLTPSVDLHYQFYDRSDLTERIVTLGLGVTFH